MQVTELPNSCGSFVLRIPACVMVHTGIPTLGKDQEIDGQLWLRREQAGTQSYPEPFPQKTGANSHACVRDGGTHLLPQHLSG